MFNYLEDYDFLEKLNKHNIRVQYAKITLLSFDEKFIKELQGTITAGSLNINGSAAIRRTISLNMSVPFEKFSITDLDSDISINKKIKVEIGYRNPLKDYQHYGDIIWFPCGVFLVSSTSMTRSTSSWNVSITGKDKMALLNGQVGGTLPASITFHESYIYDEDGNATIKYPTIFQIIQEVVHHWGRENIDNIIINDIPSTAKLLVKYSGDSPIFFSDDYYNFSYEKRDGYGEDKDHRFVKGQDVGYENTDFTYPGELIVAAGESVVSVLDKIKGILGNFEYFYDVNGKFIFQEKKNFLSQNSPLRDLKLEDYILSYSNIKHKYSLTDLTTVSSLGQTPRYDNIKNDFIVWGKRVTPAGAEIPIRYHLAIDRKPQDIPFIDDESQCSLCHKYLTKVFAAGTKQLLRYIVSREPASAADINPGEELGKEVAAPLETKDLPFEWREELFRQALLNSATGVSLGPYDAELLAEWRKLYDPFNLEWKDGWNPDVYTNPNVLDYWLDFIDTNSQIGNYSVGSIGRRTKVINDSNINSIYNMKVPDVVFLQNTDPNFKELQEYYVSINQAFVPLPEVIYDDFVASPTKASAFDKIRELLYQHLTYNTQVSISCLPCYYMEPNNIIYIEDTQSNVVGNYEVSQFSLPLTHSGMMSITCTEVLTRV